MKPEMLHVGTYRKRRGNVDRGGLRFGALTGLFFGVQLLSSIARDKRDMQDSINAALVTGGLFGALCKPHTTSLV